MEEGNSERKVKDGKLLRVKVQFNSRIVNVKLTGDFFVHPEEKLEELEKQFERLSIKETEEHLTRLADHFCKKYEIELVGITPQDIGKGIREALDNVESNTA